MGLKLECIVCGRKFSQGQGVVVTLGGRSYSFHSKGCALKFLKKVLEGVEQQKILEVAERVAEEFKTVLKEKAESVAKKIA
ncbi:MAG: hypothetical protein QXS42_03655 [Zestosphaera sp.]